ncbi:hypothetical protein DUNSADRAFT_70 [Dunaliella salina]|uniref:SMC hinge domain-containing protein n=1 Tax=Dunaliella salina TaxID=3046 RepID=A0ABQ7H8U6_DUNSA|nr:hypothetical protein DUNSADRAFT_70 [Dunaliella salina]|eukprot:KAF5843268.1 hypothetical protein DUNSADRAFT_70 [Dunaliella salina]
MQADLDDVEGLVQALLTEVELQAGGETLELQARVDKLAMELTRGTTTWRSKCDTLASEQATLEGLQTALQELSDQDHDAKVARSVEARTEAQAALEAAEGSVSAAQREVAGAEAGDGRDESNRSLQERLADAQTEATHADSEAKAADVRAKHLAKQLAEQQKALGSKQQDAGSLQKELAHQQAVVDKSTKKLQSLAFDEAAHNALEEAREAQSLEVRQAREAVDRLSQDVAGWCEFRYSPPDASFDKSRVHGVLARLVQVKDPSTTLALEVAAGSRLYQVVVDDASTAQKLLEKGRLTQRVTIIPLDKVYAPNLPSSVVNAADRMGGGKAKPALELVGSSDHLQAALKYAFGTSLVCEDAATARRLAFSREVSTRCVTLDGDDFNPSGLLTGGSRPGGRCVLATLHDLAAAEARLDAACAKLASIEHQLAATSSAQAEYNKLRQEVSLASHSLSLLQERMACSESAQLAASVAALSTELAESKQAADAARTKSKEVAAMSKNLEREIANFGREQGARLQAAKEKLKAAKAGVDRCRKALKAAEQQVAMANAERDAVGEERVGLQAKIEASTQAVAALKAEEAELRESTATSRDAYEGAVAQLNTRKKRMQESDEEIAGHRQAAARLMRAIQELDVEAHRIEKKSKAIADHGNKCAEFAAKVESEYSWVSVEKAGFGSGDYNFNNYDMRKSKLDYTEAEARREELKGRVNSKALDKLEKAESEYNGLMSKRQIVDNDRQCILQVIEDLDDKKKIAMKDTWHKVNGFFSSIFTTLLPGAQAKLVPPENQTFLEGLEVKVAFGGVWKESLTELSGGQRSLLALSLLLALCRFQPAPLYILDEVDAALDLNHTQNIGSMIKAHFPQSQFIVVSLKEGMFNNANIIFRTKFVDGVSAVTRTVTQRGRAEQQQQKGRSNVVAADTRRVLGNAN